MVMMSDKTLHKLGYVVTFIASVICFVPLLSNNINLQEFDGTDAIPLIHALSSVELQVSVVASISISIPILADLILDSFFFSLRSLYPYKLVMFVLVLSSIITNIIIYVNIIPDLNFKLLCVIIPAQCIYTSTCGAYLLNSLIPTIFKKQYVIIFIFSYTLSQITAAFSPFTMPKTQLILYVIRAVTAVITLLILFLIFISWCTKFISTHQEKTSKITSNDIFFAFNILAFILLVLATWVMELMYGHSTFLVMSSGALSSLIHALNIYSIFVTAFHARLMKEHVIHSLVEKEAETKRTLVGFFSHEIRTPLNSVLMGLQVLKRDLFNPNSSTSNMIQLVDEMNGSCDTVVDILNDLLLYERLEEGVIDLNFNPVYVKTFFERKIQQLKSQSIDKGIELKLEFHDENVSGRWQNMTTSCIKGDEDKFGQVIRNIVFNAIESTPNGGNIIISVSIIEKTISTTHDKTKRKKKKKNKTNVEDKANVSAGRKDKYCESNKDLMASLKYILSIEVRDTGAGIAPDKIDRVFESALKFTPGVLQTHEGKGLGLWIAKQIIELHDGHLSVRSDGEGTGSTFTIQLPIYFTSPTGRIDMLQLTSCKAISSWMRLNTDVDPDSGVEPSIQSFRATPSPGLPRSFSAAADNLLRTTSIKSSPLSRWRIAGSAVRLYPSSSGAAQSVLSAIPQSEVEVEGEHSVSDGDDSFHEYSLHDIPTTPTRLNSLQSQCSVFLSAPVDVSTRVLVVDDGPTNRKMLCRLLVGYCDSTVEAEDGVIAVEKMKMSMDECNTFDLVLMDYQMPNMDGPEAAKCMREMGYKGPIIGVTGNALASHIQTFLSRGADRVLQKPLKFDTLIRTLTGGVK